MATGKFAGLCPRQGGDPGVRGVPSTGWMERSTLRCWAPATVPGGTHREGGRERSTWGYWKDGGAVGTRVLHPLWIPGVNHGPQSRSQRPWGAAGGRQRGWHLSVPQGGGSWFPGEWDGGCGVRMAVPPPGASRHTPVTAGGQGSHHPAGWGAGRGPSPAGWVALDGVAKTPARHRGAEERL